MSKYNWFKHRKALINKSYCYTGSDTSTLPPIFYPDRVELSSNGYYMIDAFVESSGNSSLMIGNQQYSCVYGNNSSSHNIAYIGKEKDVITFRSDRPGRVHVRILNNNIYTGELQSR